ncbi:hypothetical protein WJX82_007259 [Trebouxia sp. C0006]
MAVTPAILLAKLQGLDIPTEVINHPAVLTVEEANKYTGDDPGVDVKNLFLKDKKNRLFLVSAEASTKVDLKALGIRLGVPKPGVRMAPSELLESVLGVPLGSVTPLAVVQPTASSVVLLLDQKLKGQERILVHPLTNDKTVAISSDGLEAFLRSLQQEAHYVDLEAQPAAGAGQADLRHLLPTDSNIETAEKQAESTSESQSSSSTSTTLNPAANMPIKAKNANAKEAKQPAKAESVPPLLSMQDLATNIVQQILQGRGGDAKTLLPETVKKLSDAVFLQLNSLQNTAYSNGYKAAKHEVAEYCMKTFGS